jgi:hypothetical protein
MNVDLGYFTQDRTGSTLSTGARRRSSRCNEVTLEVEGQGIPQSWS